MACTSCFTGEVQDETPTGNVTKLYGRDTYVAEPPRGVSLKGTIIIIPDAFGWTFVNNRLLADKYAKNGSFRVYLPDFMDGKNSYLFISFVFNHTRKTDSFCFNVLLQFMGYARRAFRCDKTVLNLPM